MPIEESWRFRTEEITGVEQGNACQEGMGNSNEKRFPAGLMGAWYLFKR